MSQSATEKDMIARRYGRVFFELAEEQKKTQEIIKETEMLYSLLKGDEKVWEVITNPTIRPARQYEIAAALVKAKKLSKLTHHFLKVLVDRNRLSLLPRILSAFIDEYKKATGQIAGRLQSPIALPNADLDSLSKALKNSTGFDVTLSHDLQPDLLGGVVLQIGSLMVDASLSNRLNKLRQTMKG